MDLISFMLVTSCESSKWSVLDQNREQKEQVYFQANINYCLPFFLYHNINGKVIFSTVLIKNKALESSERKSAHL